MKVLILTQYFPPEVGAPQNRLFDLAKEFKKNSEEVDVFTAMPNYPNMEILEEYRGRLFLKENLQGINVFRSWIFIKKTTSIFYRLINYFSFVITSLIYGVIKLKKYDILICESPPLFLGISALLLSRIKKAKLVFNVSDLWPETAEKLNLINNRFLLWITEKLELYIYRKSALVSGQTKGIVASINKRTKNVKTFLYRNGINLSSKKIDKTDKSWREEKSISPGDFILFYGGIIGYPQGLDVILRAAKLLTHIPNIKFVLQGNGPEKERLIKLKEELKLENVFFFPPVSKMKMNEILPQIDAGIIPLKKLDLFLGAIPSKIFEYFVHSKPILLGVDGEARELFVDEGKCSLYFTPENHEELAEKVSQLYNNPDLGKELGRAGNLFVHERFDIEMIVKEFHKVLKSL
jgi:glycosyltransferase involved in cell wall biosynthesis